MKLLFRDTLSLLSDLLTIVMGHFFPTTGEVGISFHGNHMNVLAMRWAMRQITYISHVWYQWKLFFFRGNICCNNHFNKTYFRYGVSILVIDPIDFAILGMINVNKLHGRLITTYLWLIKYEMRWGTMPTATWHTPSSLKTGRHSQLWSSTLHLMHSWAQLHRQSLSGIYASKSGSCWMNLSSRWPTTVWFQLLLCQYQLIVACCNLFGCNGAVVLCVCWHVTIIVIITIIMIVKWH